MAAPSRSSFVSTRRCARVGATVTAGWAPEVYPLDDDGMIDIHLLEVPPQLAEAAWMGAQACPAGVISIVDVKPTSGAPTHSGGPTP
jgi:ferredoxin